MEKVGSYLILRQKTSQEATEEELLYDVEDNKSQMQLDLRATNRAITQAKRELLKMKTLKVLDSNKIVSKMDEIANLEAGEKTLKELISELFED